MDHPKVFISYSWQPKENQIRVQQLAERLSSDGVHVIIDIWDLQDGQDKNVFMEQMVSNPEVKKVLLICNKEYATKANNRKGGVGIESTIISEELYQNTEQTKFIPIVFEYDENGNPFVPLFAKSRIYIDLSIEDKYLEGYDQLLRDIYGKPRYQRPPLGEMPTYLNDDVPVFLPTANKVSQIKQAIYSANPITPILIQDYFECFISAISTYRIDKSDITWDSFIEKVEQGIVDLYPLKNDFIALLQIIAGTNYLTPEMLLDFFERMLQQYEDNDISLYTGPSLSALCFDNYRFFNYDLFVSVIAILLMKERFDIVFELVFHHFCIIEDRRNEPSKEVTFLHFNKYNYTLNKYKNERNQSQRVSIVADIVYKNTIVRFDDLVKTDLLLYYLSILYPSRVLNDRYWFPELSPYNNQFEVLPRLASCRYFSRAKVLFNVDTVEEFKQLISSIKEPDLHDGYHNIPNIKVGLSMEKAGTII